MSELTPDEILIALDEGHTITAEDIEAWADAWQADIEAKDKRIAELEAAIATFRDNPITKNQFAMFEALDK